MTTTPTGIPIVDCSKCGRRHPETRKHCDVCGLATLFGHDACRAVCSCGHAALHHHAKSRDGDSGGCLGADRIYNTSEDGGA